MLVVTSTRGDGGVVAAGRWNWRAAARCRTSEAEALFVVGARQRQATQLCVSCAVRTECLAHALDHRIQHGVWGGMTERARRALLRARPDVPSWADLLLNARDAHYASEVEVAAEQLAIAAERAQHERKDGQAPLGESA